MTKDITDWRENRRVDETMRIAWRSSGANAALILLLTIVAYLPTLRGGFVFDDFPLIVENRMIQRNAEPYRFWFTSETPDYRPVTWSLWWLEWRLWDGKAPAYHAVNVLFHAVDAVLVWIILRELEISGAWLVAAVFAVHPVNVATVAWISEQKNTLSMLFYALSVLLYLQFDKARRWRWYGLSVTAGLLALLTKTAVVMLPVVLLGCMWWRHGRVRRRDWVCSVPYFVASMALALVTIVQHHRALGAIEVRTGGFAARLAVAGWIPWFYLSKALVPVDLTMIYPKWAVDASRWISYVPGVILIGGLALFWWKRRIWGRPLFFGLGYFVVMLFPVLGFFDQAFYRFSFVADHWQYYSIIGVIALAVAFGRNVVHWVSQGDRFVGVLASIAVLALLGVATWNRSCVYADDATLWQDNLAKDPRAFVAHYNLAVDLEKTGRIGDAIEHYQDALEIRPDYIDARNNLAAAWGRVGRVGEAIREYQQVLEMEPDLAEAHNNLGNALVRVGRIQEAIGHYEQALKLKPDYAEAHYNLGIALERLGRVGEARAHYESALQLKPDYAEAHNNLGSVLAGQGKVPEAIQHWEQALRINPNYARAHYNLGIALEKSGRAREASEHYEAAIRLNPSLAEARNALARLGTAH